VVTTDEKEKDLGVIIHQTLKSNSQRVAAANSANKTLGMINRTIVKIFGNVFGVGPTNGGIAEAPEFPGDFKFAKCGPISDAPACRSDSEYISRNFPL